MAWLKRTQSNPRVRSEMADFLRWLIDAYYDDENAGDNKDPDSWRHRLRQPDPAGWRHQLRLLEDGQPVRCRAWELPVGTPYPAEIDPTDVVVVGPDGSITKAPAPKQQVRKSITRRSDT